MQVLKCGVLDDLVDDGSDLLRDMAPSLHPFTVFLQLQAHTDHRLPLLLSVVCTCAILFVLHN
jgi:hypothetical protein